MPVITPTGTPSYQTIASHLASAQVHLPTNIERARYHANRASTLLNLASTQARAGSAS